VQLCKLKLIQERQTMERTENLKIKNRKIERNFNIVFSSLMMFYVLFLFTLFLCMLLFADFRHFIELLLKKSTLYSIYLSIITSTIATLLSLLFAIPIGYILSRYNFRGKNILTLLINLPITLPPLVAGVCLLIFFQTGIGKLITSTGFKFVFDVKGIVLAQFFISASFSIISLKSTFNEIEKNNEIVARTLGCNKLQAFFFVTLPEARYGIASAVVLTWSRAVGEFVPILLFVGAIEGKTDILPIAIFLKIETGNLNDAILLTIVFILLCIIILPLANLLIKKQKKVIN
jgi:molybdate transport system permease protein